MAESSYSPLLNPVLVLQRQPRPQRPKGGGKDTSKVVKTRLRDQKVQLAEECEQILSKREVIPKFAGKFHLIATMFNDSLAPTYEPRDLLNASVGCRLVAPFIQGYLIEASISRISHLIRTIRNPQNVATRVDVSRLKNLSSFDQNALARGSNLNKLWDVAHELDDGRLFTVWLIPFHTPAARQELLETLGRLVSENTSISDLLISQSSPSRIVDSPSDELFPFSSSRRSSIARAFRSYRNTGVARASILFHDFKALEELASAGIFYRIDPVTRLSNTSHSDNVRGGPEVPDVSEEPIVAVIDGGMNSPRYQNAEAWSAPPFVPDRFADSAHGNQVSSLVVHGHQWNPNHSLPELNCGIGTIQAIPSASIVYRFNIEQFVEYLSSVAQLHPEAHVWNVSANATEPEMEADHISFLGDALAQLARTHNLLPIVSVGNVSASNNNRLCAPCRL